MESYKKKKQKKLKSKFQKLNIIFLWITLVVCVCAFVIKLFFPTILFELGKNAYERGDYQASAKLLKASSLLNPEDNQCLYYWADSLSKLPLTYESQQDLYKITQLDNDSAADLLATTILKTFKVNFMLKVGENYIENALFNNQVLHWNLNSMPLTYYVDYSISVPQYYAEAINKSFKEWQEKTGQLIKFKPVDRMEDANIILFFKNVDNSVMAKDGRVEYNVGEANPIIENGYLKQMKIQIITQNNLKQYFSSGEISTVMKHEIGHALGIWGHSNDINNIMYYSASQEFGFLNSSEKEISPQDINTLRLLYFFAPEITDKKIASTEKNYYLYAPIIINKLEGNSDFYIQKSLDFARKRPDDVNRWIELAGAYSSSKNYDESIDVLNKAVQMTQDTETLSIIYYNLANDYINIKEPTQAMDCANKAKEIKNDFEIKSLIAYIKYKKGDLKDAKEDLLILQEENPANIDNALTLADVYIKERKYFDARSTLKNLTKNNPDAANDERLSYYKIYTLF